MGNAASKKYSERNTISLSVRDQASIWHPYTQHQSAALPIAVTRAEGAYLYDEEGKSYLDLISSWWVNLFGHSHPDIAAAIYKQALSLEQVIFAGFTHEPAVSLAEQLLKILPTGFSKVFYSDNGSTAVEVALKMAYQYWRNKGETQRNRFLAFRGGYHGDTFGAMSIGLSSGFFRAYTDLCFTVDMAPYPATWINDEDVHLKEEQALIWLENHLELHGKNTAALIIEPLVQGASGMNMCRKEFLQKVEALSQHYGILIIYDEVMTGFGRCGTFFACQKAGTQPDIICLAKGLTGGFLPLAVTVCRDSIYQAFLGQDFSSALVHGHSYTANPLGCAAALAGMNLLASEPIQIQIQKIERVHLERIGNMPGTRARYCGTISAFDLDQSTEYGSIHSQNLRAYFLNEGLLIRPLGNTIYLLPPYCVTEEELQSAYDVMEKIVV